MRKSFVVFAVAVCLMAASSLAMAADGKVFKMRATTLYMDKHLVIQKVYIPFFEEVKKRTNGQVEITYFNPGTICPEPDHFEALQKGQIDIGGHLVSRNPGKLVPTTVANTSTNATSARAGAAAFWKLYTNSPLLQKDLDGIKVLTLHTTAPAHFSMIKTQIKTLADFDSKKMIVAGGDGSRMVRALGGQPVALPATDYYLSLSRGMADGCNIPIAPMRSYKINEATKYTTLVSTTMGGLWLGMNKKLWDSLPADVQKVIDELSGEMLSKQAAATLDQADLDDIKIMTEQGQVFYTMPPEERAKVMAVVHPVLKDAWMERVAKSTISGEDAEALYKQYQGYATEAEAIYSKK